MAKSHDTKLACFLQPATKREKAALAGVQAKPGRVTGYARVSTVQQSTEGESLEVQQRTIAGYAQMHGFELACSSNAASPAASRSMNGRKARPCCATCGPATSSSHRSSTACSAPRSMPSASWPR